ncbi:hypothetical protein JTF06_02885 [Desemzia sp. RIT804]|uniref:hypothetical protein n=1 Tax=Desemzia sp. RIT 804 TaxID=2810209 RepID=UPI00194F88A7|nr:hypothetical protein [Desemzia sp. RIT 804]MBM6613839.1 hypothetical protein [Desemzia sp. RIT 804]
MIDKMKPFIKSYIHLVLICYAYDILFGSLNLSSMIWLALVSLPVAAIMVFTGLDTKLESYLP